MKTHILTAAAAALLVSVAAGTAKAGPISASVSHDATKFTYTITGSDIAQNATFTIYDIGSLSFTPHGDLANSSLWTFNETPTTSSAFITFEDPTLLNLNFTFIGAGGVGASLGQCNVAGGIGGSPANCTVDVFGTGSRDVAFTSNNGGPHGLNEHDTISAPLLPVPEPASLALLGIGLAGIATIRRRKAA